MSLPLLKVGLCEIVAAKDALIPTCVLHNTKVFLTIENYVEIFISCQEKTLKCNIALVRDYNFYSV